MKKMTAAVFFTAVLMAAEPVQFGAYYGDIKVQISNYNSYPNQQARSAGQLYLYKQGKSDIDFIVESKQAHIEAGLEEAKALAKKNGNKYFAIDRVTHQVTVTENSIIVLTDYNVLSFD